MLLRASTSLIVATSVAWLAAADMASAQTGKQQDGLPPPKSAPERAPSPDSGPPPSPGQPGAPSAPNAGPAAPGQNPGQPPARGQRGAAAAAKTPPGISIQKPKTPAEREKALSDLYAHLATADDEAAAKTAATRIERLWLDGAGDTIAVLMDRANKALAEKKPALAFKFLDSVVKLAPDYAEGWHKRAYAHFTENNFERAVGDLRRVLALDPNHYRALEALGHIMREIGQKKAALVAYKKLLEVHPFADGAKTAHDELAREVEGQAL